MSRSTSELIGTDSIRVTRDEAVELMTHYLLMAHIYYQATPDGPGAQAEMLRIMESKGCTDGEIRAHRVWVAAMDQYYAQLREEQGP